MKSTQSASGKATALRVPTCSGESAAMHAASGDQCQCEDCHLFFPGGSLWCFPHGDICDDCKEERHDAGLQSEAFGTSPRQPVAAIPSPVRILSAPVCPAEPDLNDFETVSEWTSAREKWTALVGSAYLRLSDILSPFGGLEWNGPSGNLLGARLICEESLLGSPVTEWPLRQVTDLLNRVRKEYNERWQPMHEVRAAS